MTYVDYELKVLLRELFRDPENRTVSEKYLALTMFEAAESVPRVLGRLHREINDHGSKDSCLDEEKFREASARYSGGTVKEIRRDAQFWNALVTIRNSSQVTTWVEATNGCSHSRRGS